MHILNTFAPYFRTLKLAITGLVGSIITSDSVKESIEALDSAESEETATGFIEWTSGTDANTYTITANKFQIDRTGRGRIKGKEIVWASGQQTVALTANLMHWIYIDSNGTLGYATSVSATLFSDNIILYEVLYDGTNYIVCKENHPYWFQTKISGYLHSVIGTIIRGTGAIITRVATGTGGAAGDRQIKIVGADTLDDHGLNTTIPDSAGAAVTWNVYYRNAGGKWIRYVQQTEFPIFYNNAGTPTALDAVNHHAVYVAYVAKDDIEGSGPQYIAVMDETVYTTAGDAEAAVAAGTVVFATNELRSVEAAQLGYVLVHKPVGDGYIHSLIVAKSTLNQQLVGGAASSDHSLLSNLDYASSGHTGFAAALGADDNYVTDAEKVVIGNTSGTNSGNQTTIVGITGTIAQFNTACTDADFAIGGGTATGSNTGDQTSIVGITGTIAQFNTACTDADFTTGGGTATGSNTGDNAANSSAMFVGTTSHALNRASAAEALTGITSIDGSAATLTTSRNIGGRAFNGSADIVSPTWKCGQTTRDISTASGAQNIAHGLGRVPSFVHIRALMVFSAAVSMECNAQYDGTSQSGQCVIWTEGTTTATTDNIYQSTAAAVGLSNAGGVNPFTGATKASGVITVDATNIIITWTKSGSPTGTANLAWEVT